MRKNRPMRFPRLRAWLLRQLNRFSPPEQPTAQELQGYINTQATELARRISAPLFHSQPTVWIDPAVYQSPSEPFLHITDPLKRALASNDAGRRRRIIYQERASQTQHELPAVSRPLQQYIDAWSRNAPPGYPLIVKPLPDGDKDATKRMTAVRKLELKQL